MSFLRGLLGPPNIEKLKSHGNVNKLIKALTYDLDASVPRLAAQALGEIGDTQAIDPLIATLNDQTFQTQVAIVEALSRFNEKRAVEALVKLLHDDSLQGVVERILEIKLVKKSGENSEATYRNHRHDLVVTLGNRGGERAVRLLILALKDEAEIVSRSALIHLATIGDIQAFDSLVALLEDQDSLTRKHAITGLGNIGDERAIDPLVHVLKNDRYFEVRKAASKALDLLEWQPTNETDRVYYQTISQFTFHTKTRFEPDYEQWEDVAHNLGIVAFEPFAFALKDESYHIRRAAITALGQIEDDRVFELMVAALKDDDHLVRMIASEKLGRIGDIRAIPPLLDALFAPFNVTTPSSSPHIYNSSVRSSFVDALAKIGGPQVVEPFLAIFGDIKINPPLRSRVAEALGNIGDRRAIEPLMRALTYEIEPLIKLNAKEALGKIKKKLEDAQ